jgi:hypothetical protein
MKHRLTLTLPEPSTRRDKIDNILLLKKAFCGHGGIGGAVAWVVSKFNVLKPL